MKLIIIIVPGKVSAHFAIILRNPIMNFKYLFFFVIIFAGLVFLQAAEKGSTEVCKPNECMCATGPQCSEKCCRQKRKASIECTIDQDCDDGKECQVGRKQSKCVNNKKK
uniref:Uncharacterized protein n=1 Tax=Ditylenchus dipsaci TaxID=166011 RepID=A0A915D197_9BILA